MGVRPLCHSESNSGRCEADTEVSIENDTPDRITATCVVNNKELIGQRRLDRDTATISAPNVWNSTMS